MTGRLHLPPRYRRVLEGLLREHVPEAEVWAFGSRITGESHEGSDLNLVVRGPDLKPLGDGFFELLEAIEKSNIPIRVRAHDWARLPESFRTEFQSDYVVVQSGAKMKDVAAFEDWREVRLGTCSVINELTYSPREGWPIINYLDTGNISENRVSDIQKLTVGSDKVPSRARRKVQSGDIVYSTVRPNQRHYGLLKSVPKYFLASTGFAVLRGKDGIADTGFLYWYLTQKQIVDYLHSIAENSTSAYPSIRPSDLEQLTLRLPPLPEQRDIAHILGTLDDKIELNRRMNKTLEEMALFKSWFVDFDPVHAKVALASSPSEKGDWTMERARAYLESMDQDIVDLFPDRLVDSELGEIPEGWEVGVLNDAIELLSGGTPRTSVSSYWDGGVPWYTAKDSPSLSDVFVLQTERTISREGVDNSAAKILPFGTTIITARGTVGRLACLGVPMAINQTCYGIRGAHGYPDLFTYMIVRRSVDELHQRTHGTVFDTITRQTFKFVETVMPTVELALVFESKVEPVLGRILNNLHESRTLVDKRHSLLPKLVSGQVRIVD